MKNDTFSKRIANIEEYFFASTARKVEEIEKKAGRKVLNLGPGNPDFPPNSLYIKKLSEFYEMPNAHFYPGFKGTDKFNQSLTAWYKKRFNVELSSLEVMPLLGAKDVVAHMPFIFLDEGDEVLIPDPGYPVFSGPVAYLCCCKRRCSPNNQH